MTNALVPVPFHGVTLFLIKQNNEPYTPMKPIVEGMGLDWNGQHKKLRSNELRWGISVMEIPSERGVQETLCMPLRKLPGWLMTIHPSRVKPELREKILRYQNECDDVLWEYWTKGHATNPRVETLSSAHKRDLQEIVASRASEYPEGLRGGIYPQLWGKLKTHFRVRTYADLPDALFEEARAFLERVPLDEPAPARGIRPVENPKARIPDLKSARDTLTYLERWGQDLPEPARMSFLELVGELKQVVVHDWTAIDEALLRIGTGLAMLRRFRGLGRS